MALGTTLGQLVSMFRDEAGLASTAALSQNSLEAIKTTLRRVQDFLYTDFYWPHLVVERDEPLRAQEIYYTFDPDLDPYRIAQAWTRDEPDNDWTPVLFGITYGMRNASSVEQGDTADRIRAYDYYEDGQFEVWPAPDTDLGVLRFSGLRKLRPMIQDADRADLDDRLIVLYAASQWLARSKDPAADMVAKTADNYYRMYRANTSRRTVRPIQAQEPTWTGISIAPPGDGPWRTSK